MYQLIDLIYSAASEELFSRLRHLPGAIWFDSGKPSSHYGRYDIMSALPTSELLFDGKNCQIFTDGNRQVCQEDPFTLAQQLLDSQPVVSNASNLPFCGGLAGFFSYDLGNGLEDIASTNPVVGDLPQLKLGLYQWSLVVDHVTQKTKLCFLQSCTDEFIAQIQSALNKDIIDSELDFQLSAPFQQSISPQQYQASLTKIDDYIHAGDCYQVNFAQHFSATYVGDEWQAYKMLRRAVPSPYSAYYKLDQQALLCISPERFLSVTDGCVEAKPIKGTIARNDNHLVDELNRKTLFNSSKDRAENLMIVDLLRNDLGKACEPGSIQVEKLFDIESFANVHHLVSTIKGKLANDQSNLDLLKACFPGGSITGAPKRRAMQIINELETVQRSIYCGSIGYISRCGHMDSNIAIRTILAEAGTLHCWGGGGIVADSIADSEYQESLTKVQKLLDKLEKTLQ
jgi:para-aminobenzoate synthetase component 1